MWGKEIHAGELSLTLWSSVRRLMIQIFTGQTKHVAYLHMAEMITDSSPRSRDFPVTKIIMYQMLHVGIV